MTTKEFQLYFFIFFILLKATHSQNQNGSDPSHQSEQNVKTLNQSEIWGFGFLAGFGISAIGFITALFMVWCKKFASDSCFQMIIKFFFSLAFGALLGDAMIHILPSAYTVEGSDPRIVAAIFIGSILFFIILERVFAACGIVHQHWHSNDCHDDHEGAIEHHNHPNRIQNEEFSQSNNQGTLKVVAIASTNMMIEQNSSGTHKCKHNHQHNLQHKYQHNHQNPKIHPQHNHDHSNQNESHKHEHEQNPHSHSHEHTKECEEKKSCLENLKGKGTAGYMNLLGSFIHNFMDGLALGVAFATGHPSDFIPILIAIVAHEIPRQMGDVAILMTNKFTGIQTVLCNGMVNLVSLLGVIIGLAIATLQEVTKQYILVFVAGNFIFIAADIWRHLFKNNSFGKNFVQFFGFGLGVAIMYLVLLLQSEQGHDH